jgi:hypothetical protein
MMQAQLAGGGGEIRELVEVRNWLEPGGEVLVHHHLDDVGRDVLDDALAVSGLS